jgi:hypothetical protein
MVGPTHLAAVTGGPGVGRAARTGVFGISTADRPDCLVSTASRHGAPCRTRTCDLPLRRRRLGKLQWPRQFGLLLLLWLPALCFWSLHVEARAPVYDLTPKSDGGHERPPERGREENDERGQHASAGRGVHHLRDRPWGLTRFRFRLQGAAPAPGVAEAFSRSPDRARWQSARLRRWWRGRSRPSAAHRREDEARRVARATVRLPVSSAAPGRVVARSRPETSRVPGRRCKGHPLGPGRGINTDQRGLPWATLPSSLRSSTPMQYRTPLRNACRDRRRLR